MISADRLAADPPLAPEETRRRADEHACQDCDRQGWSIGGLLVGGLLWPEIDMCVCMDDLPDDQRIYSDDVALLPEAQAALAAAVRRQILFDGPEREDYEDR